MDIINILVSAGLGFLGGAGSGVLISNHNYKKEEMRFNRRQQDDIYQDIIDRASQLNFCMKSRIKGEYPNQRVESIIKLNELNNLKSGKSHLLAKKQKSYFTDYLLLLNRYGKTMGELDVWEGKGEERMLIEGEIDKNSLENQLLELKKGINPKQEYFLLWPK